MNGNYQTVFDITNEGFDLSFIIPLIFVIGFTLILFLTRKIRNHRNNKFWNTYAFFFNIIFLGLASFIFLFALNSSYKKYSVIKEITKNKTYLTIEGPVKNFTKFELSENEMESFSINGVYFEYSDYYHNGGYNKTSIRGGVINSEGQWLKLHYHNKDNENRIIKIEKLK